MYSIRIASVTNLHFSDQRSHDLSPRRPVSVLKSVANSGTERLQLINRRPHLLCPESRSTAALSRASNFTVAPWQRGVGARIPLGPEILPGRNRSNALSHAGPGRFNRASCSAGRPAFLRMPRERSRTRDGLELDPTGASKRPATLPRRSDRSGTGVVADALSAEAICVRPHASIVGVLTWFTLARRNT